VYSAANGPSVVGGGGGALGGDGATAATAAAEERARRVMSAFEFGLASEWPEQLAF
jgi:hypothetical protein